MAFVELTRASSITPEPIDWLWHGWLPAKKLCIIAGAPCTGKTTLAVSIAAILSNGGIGGNCWPDGTFSLIGNVLIWSGEDDIESTLVPRLMAANANLANVNFIVGTHEQGKRRRPFNFERTFLNSAKQSIELEVFGW